MMQNLNQLPIILHPTHAFPNMHNLILIIVLQTCPPLRLRRAEPSGSSRLCLGCASDACAASMEIILVFVIIVA
jgi:hypothetical protein